MMLPALIVIYIAAAVAANYAVWLWGQPALVFTASLLVPIDLITRDLMHERFGKYWHVGIASVVIAGSVITWLANPASGTVALASATAFASAGAVNTAIFAALAGTTRHWRMITSNAFAAIADSIVFPLVAFGMLDPRLSAAQALLKAASGAIAVWILFRALKLSAPQPTRNQTPCA